MSAITRRSAIACLSVVPMIGVPRVLARHLNCRHMTDADSEAWIPRIVTLDGKDITHKCFETEEYSDGSLRAHCYVIRNGEYVLNSGRTNVETEWLEGFGTVIDA